MGSIYLGDNMRQSWTV